MTFRDHCNLKDVARGRFNNLNLIRFVLASVVILSHSYPMLHPLASEPWARYSRSGASLGDLAVLGFFFLSGYLITRSAVRNPDPAIFLRSRVLRIAPALTVVTCALVFVVGPLLSSKSLPQYFHSPAAYTYLLTGVLNHNAGLALPGVFEHNRIPEVNLPIWTLASEWSLYLMALLVCIALRARSLAQSIKPASWFAFGIAAVITYQMFPLPWKHSILWCFAFLAGGLVFAFRRKISLNIPAAFALLVVYVALVRLAPHLAKPLLPFALFYFLLVVGFHPKLHVAGFHRFGDLSYGLYVYAWPIQQILAPKFNSSLLLFCTSYALVLPVAAASWHLLEKRCLSLKNVPERVRESVPYGAEAAG